MSEESKKEYFILSAELTAEEKREAEIVRKANHDIQMSRGKQDALKLQLKALRYEQGNE